MRVNKAQIFGALVAVSCLPSFALAQSAGNGEPMSAIDWLSRSVAQPGTTVLPAEPAQSAPSRPALLPSATITMRSLDAPSLDGIGIVSATVSGLPRNLWGATPTVDLVRTIRAERLDTLPAIQALLYRILVSELAPPVDSDGSGTLFLARVDRLLDLGALDPAAALLAHVDPPRPETFRRTFDIALLTGEENASCTAMRAAPDIAPTFPARVFCLARGGDWNAAALSLRTGETLGYIDGDTATLLERFLDPDLFEGEPDLPLPPRPSPLVLRLMEAIGQPVSTGMLPPAFARSDLRSNVGWKSRLDAGERLARTGAISPNRLAGLYFERQPAASGGVWERVRAAQALDKALSSGDPNAISRALPAAWAEMSAAELEVPFATIFGERVAGYRLPGEAGRIAFRVGLLSEGYEEVAKARVPEGEDESYLIGLATGRTDGLRPPDQMGAAIAMAFRGDAPVPENFKRLLDENRAGEALLMAIDNITDGARGDLRDVSDGLAVLRAMGLESTARKAALELVLLERRG
jgi:hypothetical protein